MNNPARAKHERGSTHNASSHLEECSIPSRPLICPIATRVRPPRLDRPSVAIDLALIVACSPCSCEARCRGTDQQGVVRFAFHFKNNIETRAPARAPLLLVWQQQPPRCVLGASVNWATIALMGHQGSTSPSSSRAPTLFRAARPSRAVNYTTRVSPRIRAHTLPSSCASASLTLFGRRLETLAAGVSVARMRLPSRCPPLLEFPTGCRTTLLRRVACVRA